MGVKGITRDGIYNGLDSPRGETALDRERAVSGGDNGEGKDGWLLWVQRNGRGAGPWPNPLRARPQGRFGSKGVIYCKAAG